MDMDPLPPSPESPDRKRALDDDDHEHQINEIERQRKKQAIESTDQNGTSSMATSTMVKFEPDKEENTDVKEAGAEQDIVDKINLDIPHPPMDEDARQSVPPENITLPDIETIASSLTSSPENGKIGSSENAGDKADNTQHHLNHTMKALVTTRQADIIIGKSGCHIKEIHEATDAGVSVSELIPSASDQVLSVTGRLDNIAKAFALIATQIANDHCNQENISNPSPEMIAIKRVSFRLIVPAARLGSIIGKNGFEIRELEKKSGATVIVNKFTPNVEKPERIIYIEGVINAVRIAVYHIGTILAGNEYSTSGDNNATRADHMDQNPQSMPYYMSFHAPIQSPYVSPATSPLHFSCGRGFSPFGPPGITPPPQSVSSPSTAPAANGVLGPMPQTPVSFPYQFPAPIVTPAGNSVPVVSVPSLIIPQPHPPSSTAAASGAMNTYFQSALPPNIPPNMSGYYMPLPPTLLSHFPNQQMTHMTNFPHSHQQHHNHSYHINSHHNPNNRHHSPALQQQVVIPSDLVGCIIGRGGSKISEMRQITGCQIKVSDRPNEDGHRLVTVIGAPDAVYSAMYMIYGKLDAEKNRLALMSPQQ